MATHTSSNVQKHLAALLDADNAPAASAEGLFEGIAKYAVASVKRIYSDWTAPPVVIECAHLAGQVTLRKGLAL